MSRQTQTTTQQPPTQPDAPAARPRRRHLAVLVGVLVIVGLMTAIVVVVARAATGQDDLHRAAKVTGRVVPPANLDDSGAFLVGEADAPVTVEIYYDYMCPACGAFESANGAELDRLMQQGTVRLALRPISFLDPQSEGTRYSTRAANAFATVVNDSPDRAWAFHMALYAQQPSEGSKGLTDEQIKDIATSAGVPSEVASTFTDMTYEQWVASVTQQAFDSGVEGTPTVKINGTPFQDDLYSTGPLTDAVESEAAGR